MHPMRRHVYIALVALAASLGATSARADGALDDARAEFRRGAELAKDTQWGAALTSFERSAQLRPHPWTTFNIGVCQRALGQYVRARRSFARALEERKPDADLPAGTVDDIRRFTAEIDGLVGALDVSLEPADARVAVDGQPLEPVGSEGGVPVVLAGTLAAGRGGPAPSKTFRVLLDPGHHVFVLARDGFSDAVHAEDVRAGERRAVRLTLDRLPARISVSSTRRDAVVVVDGLDVGTAPITVLRPAGRHRVVVRKVGFDAYETDAVVAPGQHAELVAKLREERPGIFSRWWFWAAAGAVVAGATVTTYALTRPEPDRPPLDGGGLGWTVRAP